MEEGRYTVAQANAELDAKGKFVSDLISCRRGGDFVMARPEDIELIDVSPKQLVSVAAALIPFPENDESPRPRKGVLHGKGVSVRVNLGDGRIINKKKHN